MVAITLCALAFASTLIAGGYLVYLPLIPIIVFGLMTLSLAVGHIRAPKKLSAQSHWAIFCSCFLLIASVAIHASLFEFTSGLFADKQFAVAQRSRIDGIEDPERLRDIALQIHARLVQLPIVERTLDGGSEEIPSEIDVLQPMSIKADPDHLFIRMCQNSENYFGILVFPDSAPFEHGDVKMADRIWYWETP